MPDVSHGSDRKLLLGLLGSPIKHSASPAMHEAAGRAVGLRCHYQLIDIAGADSTRLKVLLDGIRWLGFAGINVTYPYKEAVLPLLDAVAPAAQAIGAVNTIVVEGERLVGHNTDATGFIRAHEQAIGPGADGPVALIGAGGVGKAIGFALTQRGVRDIRIFDRDGAKAATLAQALAAHIASVRVCDSAEAALAGAEGLVNGTPIGMLPDRGTPVPFDLLHAGLWVADAVYNPLWTPLLQAARAKGARVMTGRELAIWQGWDAFRLFTGTEPPVAAMSEAFDAVMKRREEQNRAA